MIRGDLNPNSHVAAKNPFELTALLIFTGPFAVTMMLSVVLTNRMGGGGLLSVAAVSVLFDVDVSVLSALRLLGRSNAEVVTIAIHIGKIGPRDSLCR